MDPAKYNAALPALPVQINEEIFTGMSKYELVAMTAMGSLLSSPRAVHMASVIDTAFKAADLFFEELAEAEDVES